MAKYFKGIEVVGDTPSSNVYTSPQFFSEDITEEMRRQAIGMDAINKMMADGPTQVLDDIGLKTIRGGNEGMDATQRAASRIIEGKGRKEVVVHDLETLGTSVRDTFGKKSEEDFFEVTQISLHKFHYDEGVLAAAVKDPTVLSVGISQNTSAKLSSYLDSLEADPNALFRFDDKSKRSLADLVLYEDKGHFGKETINGKDYSIMTGQAATKPSTKGTALSQKNEIARMRAGLSNLTDPTLTNTKQDVFEVLETYAGKDTVWAGYNNQRFDQPNMLEWMNRGKHKPSESVNKMIKNDQLDGYILSKYGYNQNNPETKNFQLSTVFDFLHGGEGSQQAHFAGDDTDMTGKILNDELKKIREGLIKSDNGQEVKRGDFFMSERGTGSFFESDFNRRKGQYDTTVRWDKKNNKWVPNYKFQESSVVGGHVYENLGNVQDINLDGVNHFGTVLQDQDTGVVKMIFREDKQELDDLFRTNLTKIDYGPGADMKALKSRQQYIKQDQARRHYDSLFEPEMNNTSDTIVKRLEKSYKVLDMHAELEKDGVIGKEAVKAIQDKLNLGKDEDDMYRNSYEKIEKTVAIREKLNQERGLWTDTIAEAEATYTKTTAGVSGSQSQNLFISNVKGELDATRANDKMEYSYTGMQVLPMESIKGEITYLDVTSKTSVDAKVRRALTTGKNKNKTTAMKELENMLAQAGDTMDDLKKSEIRNKVGKDLSQYNKVQPGTMTYVQTQVGVSARNSPKVVSSVPGKNIHSAVSDGTSGVNDYLNRLSPEENGFFKGVVDKAKAKTTEQLRNSKTRANMKNFDLTNVSEGAAKRMNTSSSLLQFFEESLTATQGIYGLDQGQRKKSKKVLDYSEQVNKTIKTFEDANFAVSVDYMPKTEDMILFFTEKDNGPLLSKLSANEKRNHSKVQEISIPTINNDGSVNIDGTGVMNQFKVGFNGTSGLKGPNMKVTSTPERAFNRLNKIPEKIKKEVEKQTRQGRKIDLQKIHEKEVAGYSQSIMRGQVASSFSGELNAKDAASVSSPRKNISSALGIDLSEYGDVILEREHPHAYKEFKAWQKREGMEYTNFLQSDWSPERQAGDVRSSVLSNLPRRWNEEYGTGTEAGINVTMQGQNPKQYSRGKAYAQDPRTSTPLGEANPATREQIMKSPNYQMLQSEKLEEYLRNDLGITNEYEIKRRMSESVTAYTEGYENIVGGTPDGKAHSVGVRTAYMDQKTLQEHVNSTVNELDIEMGSLESSKVTASPAKRIEIEDRMSELKLVRADLTSGKLSLSDGQMVMSESLARSLRSESEMSIRVKTGHQFQGNMQERIEEAAKGKHFDTGILRFDEPISFNEMKEMGIIDKNGLLTVGELVEEAAKSSADEAFGSQVYTVYDQSEILGINRTAKGDHLVINQVKTGHDGSKNIDMFTGERTTSVVGRNKTMEYFADKTGITAEVIRENINTGRNPYGGMLAILTETNFQNAMEDLDSVYAGGSAKLPSVQEFLEQQQKKGVSVQDLTREQLTQDFYTDVFQKDVSVMGLDDIITIGKKDSDIMVYDRMSNIKSKKHQGDELLTNPIFGPRAQENYESYLETSKSKYGFSSDNVYTRLGMHNVTETPGSTRGRYANREMSLLKTKLDDVYDVVNPDGTSSVAGHGEDNIIIKKMEQLMKGNKRDDHIKLGQSIDAVREHLKPGDNIDEIVKSNNLIFDMTGSFQSSSSENVRLGKNGEYIFDASSLGALPDAANRTKNEMKNTMADPMSILLNNKELGIVNETVAEFQERTGGNAFLKIGDPSQTNEMGASLYKKNYIPVIGNMDDRFTEFEEMDIRKIQKDTEDIYANVYNHNTRQYSSQDATRDTIAKDGMEYTQRTNQAIDDFVLDTNSYMTTSKKSGFNKGVGTMHSKQGFSGKTGSYNFYDSFEELADGTHAPTIKRRESEMFVSREKALFAIDGIEEQIFQANNLTVGDMTTKQMQENILDRMTGTRASDDAFDVIGILNRQPSGSEGSLNFMSMRVDKGASAIEGMTDNRIMIGKFAASQMGADFDGDTVYSSLDLYRKTKNNVASPQEMQKELIRQRDITEIEAKAFIASGETSADSFDGVARMSTKEADAFFNDFTGGTYEALNAVQMGSKNKGIGAMDNVTVANRDLLGHVFNQSSKRGVMDAAEYSKAIKGYDEVSDLFVQNFISAKKLTAEGMGIEQEVFDSLTGSKKMDYVMQNAEDYLGTQTKLPGMLRNIKEDNIDSLIEEMHKIGAIPEGKEELFRESYGNVAIAQEATSPFGGVSNSSFSISKSKGDPTGKFFEQSVESPGMIIPTNNANSLISNLYEADSQISMNYQAAAEKTNQSIADNVAMIKSRKLGAGMDLDESAVQQYSKMRQVMEGHQLSKKAVVSSEVIGTIKSGLSNVAGSTAFKVGAGFSAMWMLGSAIKGGPTPEGSEAEQEATPAEVNPSALLTSPTARVTPNGENVRLKVSGSGNVSQEEIAGMVNQQVGQMTGTQMNTNVNITDNTQALDKSFYENAINRILGV